MNSQKILIGGILGGVAYFFLGWLIWGIILNSMFTLSPGTEVCFRGDENMIMWAMAVSCIIWGLLFAYIFGKWAGISTFQGGAKAGALLGGALSLCIGFGNHAMLTYSSFQNIGLDTLANVVASGIVGGIIGWWLGRE